MLPAPDTTRVRRLSAIPRRSRSGSAPAFAPPGGVIPCPPKLEISTVPHRFSPVVIPTLALALAACAGDAPTTSSARAPDAQVQSLAVSGESLDGLRGSVVDARVRLVPSIGDAPVQSRLSTVLTGVSAALDANDAGALAQSLGAARTTV